MPATTQLLGLTRTRMVAHAPRFSKATQVRFTNSMVSTKTSGRAKADWGAQWKKVGGTLMMYGPVVAALMFWPYGVMPIMENVRWG